MSDLLSHTHKMAKSQVSLGQITEAYVGPDQYGRLRTFVTTTGYHNENAMVVPLFHPYGMSSRPTVDCDTILLQNNGSRTALLALATDEPAYRIPDLAPGEHGLRGLTASQIVFRGDRIEVTTPVGMIVVTSQGDIDITGKSNMNVAITGDVAVTINGNANLTVKGNIVSSAAHWQHTGNLYIKEGKLTVDNDIRDQAKTGNPFDMRTMRQFYNEHKHTGIQRGNAQTDVPFILMD